MSNEYKDRMLQLLTEVDNVQAKEAALQLERKRHQDQITQSEADLQRTEDDIGHCREEALGIFVEPWTSWRTKSSIVTSRMSRS